MKIEPKHVILSELLNEFKDDQPEFTKQLRLISSCEGCGMQMTADQLEAKCRKLFPKLVEQIQTAHANREVKDRMEEILNPDVMERLNDGLNEVIKSVSVDSDHQEETSAELEAAKIETPGAETKTE